MIKPIETVYKGYRFRSRLEARWATFFDACGVKWEYEPEGFDLGNGLYYLPDFLLHDVFDSSDIDYTQSTNLWVEVKRVMTETDANKILRFSGMAPILVVAQIPDGNDIYDLASYVCDPANNFDMFEEIAQAFNLSTVYGNNFSTLPCINKKGKFDAVPVAASDCFEDIDIGATEKAYKLARQARFEKTA